jgi:hypothetical protein
VFNGEATDTNVSLWFGPIGARTHTQSDLSTFMFVKTTDTNDRLNLTSSFKSIAGMIVFLGLGLGCCFQQYYSYIVAVSFIGGRNRRTPPTCRKSLTYFIIAVSSIPRHERDSNSQR